MSKALFNDNLYGSLPHLGGAGLIAFCDSFYYERHALMCTPGKWRVGIVGCEAGEFWSLLTQHTDAIVDDFGDLRMVS